MKTSINPLSLSLSLLMGVSLQASAQVLPCAPCYFGEYGSVAASLNMPKGTPDGKNGWIPSVTGTMKGPVVFAEINSTYGMDPVPNVTPGWLMDDCPVWANDVFDTSGPPNPHGLIPKYYRQSSSEILNAMDSGLWSTHPDIDFMDGSRLFPIGKKSLDPEISFSHL